MILKTKYLSSFIRKTKHNHQNYVIGQIFLISQKIMEEFHTAVLSITTLTF